MAASPQRHHMLALRGHAPQALGALSLALLACAPTAYEVPSTTGTGTGSALAATPTSEEASYLHDPDARRGALEVSLHTPTNLYSRQRLDAYGLRTRGWDTLPEWRPRADRLDAPLAAQLGRGERPDVVAAPLWDGQTPATPEAWIALGRRVFFEYPMRAEVYLEHVLTRPELRAALGVEATATGELPGVVYFRDTDGEHQVGLTCALCHSAVEDGQVVAGRARRRLDYGRLRLTYHADTGEPLSPEQARRMGRWGPGRADVTEDDDEDPVAIPDLWGLSAQPWLTSTGTVRHDSALALALRQETQLIDAGHQRVRPPRVLVWALTQYLYTLAPPPRAGGAPFATATAGRALFTEHCRPCHHNAALGGDRVEATRIGTDPALARGRGRGTGYYRVPALLGLDAGAPFLHDGSVPSLEALLSPARLSPGYTEGARGPGPVPGHLAGTTLSAEARGELVRYLQTL